MWSLIRKAVTVFIMSALVYAMATMGLVHTAAAHVGAPEIHQQVMSTSTHGAVLRLDAGARAFALIPAIGGGFCCACDNQTRFAHANYRIGIADLLAPGSEHVTASAAPKPPHAPPRS